MCRFLLINLFFCDIIKFDMVIYAVAFFESLGEQFISLNG